MGYELLGVGRTLADKMGQQLVALVMGKNVESVAKGEHCLRCRSGAVGGGR